MTLETAVAFAATAYGIVMALSPLLQIRLMLRTGSSDGVSLHYFGVLLAGFVLWLGYGLIREDVPIVVSNAAAIATSSSLFVVALRLRRR